MEFIDPRQSKSVYLGSAKQTYYFVCEDSNFKYTDSKYLGEDSKKQVPAMVQ